MPTKTYWPAGNDLLVGEVGSVFLTVTVLSPGSYNNQASVSGDSPGGATTTDDSHDGTEPDPVNSDPTPVELDCTVVVECPQAFQGTFTCDTDIPAAVTTVAEFNARFGANSIENFCMGAVTITSSDVTAGDGCPGTPLTLTRTYTIDHPDITAITCEVFYTVEDIETPLISTPPSDLVLECGDAGNAALISSWESNNGNASFSDNCDGTPDVTFSAGAAISTCGGTTTTVYTLTVTDACGNSQQAFANLTFVDTQDPVISLPTVSNTVECDEDITTALNTWFADASATDACNGSVDVVPSLITSITQCNGTNTEEVRTYQFFASDDCGNIEVATANFIIEDTNPPAITAPANLVVDCETLQTGGLADGISTWLSEYTVTEACQDFTVSNDYVVNSVTSNLCGGTIPVVWTVTDDCGATNTATADIVIQADNTPPAFVNCPVTDITVNVDPDLCSRNVTFSTPIAEDCNSPVTVTQVANTAGDLIRSGQEFPLGTTEIVFQAEDNCGNTSTCSFDITVEDSQEPSISCPSNDVVVCADAVSCDWTATASIAPTGVDNCPSASVTYDITGATTASGTGSAEGEVFALGTSTVEYTVTAANGQTATCSFNVIVEDCTDPIIDVCPLDIVASASITTCENEQTLTAPTVSDNCSATGDISISYRVFNPDNSVTALIPGTSLTYTFQSGISTVEWVVEDEAGNNTTCSQQVTINEVLPTVGAGADEEICISASPYSLSGTATDATSILWSTSGTGTFDDATSLTAAYTPSAADLNDGQVQLTLTASNACGSVSDQMVLGLWPEATADAGADATICEGEDHILSGASATGFASLSWTTTGTGSFSSTSSLNPIYTPSSADITAGTVTLSLTANTVAGSSCPDVSDNMVLTITAEDNITIDNIEDAGCASSDGEVTISGSNPISLNGGTPVASPATFTGLAAGFYTATTTGSCPAEVSFVINNTNNTLTASLDKDNVSCNGLSDGSATVAGIGGTAPYEYELLSPSVTNTTGVFSGLSAGNYVVVITDDEGCTYTVNFEITQPAELSTSVASQTDVACNGESTGSVVLSSSGGTPGYTYTVTSSPMGSAETVNGNIISNMIAGTYEIQVTDLIGCTATLTVVISESSVLNLSVDGSTKPYLC